jgi:hypothetical protein
VRTREIFFLNLQTIWARALKNFTILGLYRVRIYGARPKENNKAYKDGGGEVYGLSSDSLICV